MARLAQRKKEREREREREKEREREQVRNRDGVTGDQVVAFSASMKRG